MGTKPCTSRRAFQGYGSRTKTTRLGRGLATRSGRTSLDLGEVVHDSDTKGGREPRPYLSGYFRIRGLKLNWLYKFSPWFDVMPHVKFESPMRTAIGKYDGEWHVRVMST